MVPNKKISLLLIDWSEKVEKLLSRVDTDVSLDHARKQAESGCRLIGVHVDGELCGVFMIELTGGEMCVMWGAGAATGIDLTRTVLPMIEKIAKQFNCSVIFFLTKREGLIRKAESIGYAYYETVMKKVL